jgi:thiol-disulfide isomerase/thioredoxin
MNTHPTFTQVVNMNQAVLDVRFTQDIGGVDAFYRSPTSGQGTSFHSNLFGFLGRVPRHWMAILAVTLFSLAAPSLADLGEPGARVDMSTHLVADKTNVVLFYAQWNKTSMRYKEKLEEWKPDKDTALHFINLKSLKSPVAKQYKITSVPAFLIYDEEGQLKMKDQSALNEVVKMKMLD